MRFLAILAIFLAGVSFDAAAQAPPLERMDVVLKSIPNGPVAKVRGVNVSREEFIRFYTGELARMGQRTSAPVTAEARAELGMYCLRVLIQQELLFQEAQARKLRVTDEEVAASWVKEKEQLRSRAERVKGEPVTDAALLEMTGYRTEDEVKVELRRSLLIEKMARTVLDEANATVDEATIEEFYESRKDGFARPEMLTLQQIFIRAEEGKSPRAMKDREDARMKADDILKRVESGQSFDGLVRENSDGSRKDEGGIAGPLPLKAFPPFMVDTALKLKPGEVSGVLESELGFHIVKLIEFSAGEQANLEEAKDAIKRILEDREGEKAIAKFCETLINDPSDLRVFAEIEKNLAYLQN